MTSWVRLWHDMPTDPKFRTIARTAKQPLPTVVAVFTFLLADASANETERGRTTATDEDIASAFDIEESDVVAIKKAMQGRVLDGDKLAGWSKRQPKKEDNSAERSRAWRAEKQAANAAERLRTDANAQERPDTEVDTDTESKNEAPLSPPGGGAGLFSDLLKAYPLSVHTDEAKAERAWSKLSPDDQAIAISQAKAEGKASAEDRAKRSRTADAHAEFVKGLDKWLREGCFRKQRESLAAVSPDPDLVVLKSDDPLCAAISALRGKPLVFGTRGTVTVRKSEVEQARAKVAA